MLTPTVDVKHSAFQVLVALKATFSAPIVGRRHSIFQVLGSPGRNVNVNFLVDPKCYVVNSDSCLEAQCLPSF